MFKKYFLFIYFQILKKRLHRVRLNFFMELNEFHSVIKKQDFWSNICKSIEANIVSFSKIMKLIDQIEWIEKHLDIWNIFDSNFYALSLHRDIIKVISPIEEQLSIKIIQLKLLKNKHISLIENINLQDSRISILIFEIENAVEKIKSIIKQLNNNIIRYSTDRTI